MIKFRIIFQNRNQWFIQKWTRLQFKSHHTYVRQQLLDGKHQRTKHTIHSCCVCTVRCRRCCVSWKRIIITSPAAPEISEIRFAIPALLAAEVLCAGNSPFRTQLAHRPLVRHIPQPPADDCVGLRPTSQTERLRIFRSTWRKHPPCSSLRWRIDSCPRSCPPRALSFIVHIIGRCWRTLRILRWAW